MGQALSADPAWHIQQLRSSVTGEQHRAAAAIARLARANDGNRVAIAAAGGIEPLVAITRRGSAGAREAAAAALCNLACNDHANQVAIAAAGGIAPLVALARSGSAGAQEEAAGALRSLAHGNDANKVAIAAAGGIEPLVALAQSGSAGAQEEAAAALKNLACNDHANQVAIAAAGGIAPLVALARSGSAGAQEEAARALRNLAVGNAANRAAIERAQAGETAGAAATPAVAPPPPQAPPPAPPAESAAALATERRLRLEAEASLRQAQDALSAREQLVAELLAADEAQAEQQSTVAAAEAALQQERRQREALEARLRQAEQQRAAEVQALQQRLEAAEARAQAAEAALRQQAQQRLEAAQARAQAAEAALRQQAAGVPPLSLGARPLVEFALRYEVPPQADAAPRTAALWSLGDAAPPASSEVAMLRRLWGRGGRQRQAVRGFELTRIEAVQVDGELQTSFLRQAKQLNENRVNGPEAMFSPRTADPDGEKAAVLRQLKEELLPLDGLPRCGVVLGLHGTSHDNADNLFRGGFAQINFDDNGYFGKGLYVSTHAEHACKYATGEAFGGDREPNERGEFVLVGCYVALGMTYAISRAVDYDAPDAAGSFSRYYTPPGRPAISLEHNHQSHYVAIDAEHKQCSDGLRRPGVRADYDELVCQSQVQLLPAYKLFFRRA